MQIIFEPDDLVMRQVIIKTEFTKDGFKGNVIATIVGRKHEDKDRYLDCAFLTQSDGMWYGRKYADIIIDKNLFQLPDGPKKGDIVISDEMIVTKPISSLYNYFLEVHSIFKPKDGVSLKICSDGNLLRRKIEKESKIEYTEKEFCGDNIVKLLIGTNGHQWNTACGHETLVDVIVEDLACTRWELHTTENSEGLESLRIILDGDAEYDNLIDICEKIAEVLRNKK